MSELFKQIKIGETTYDVGANAENVAFNENTSVKEQIQNNIDSIKNKADKSSIGNGTITINQGGTIKGSFSVNQSGNQTINLDAGGGSGGVAATDAIIENSLTVNGYVVEGKGHSYPNDMNFKTINFYNQPTVTTNSTNITINEIIYNKVAHFSSSEAYTFIKNNGNVIKNNQYYYGKMPQKSCSGEEIEVEGYFYLLSCDETSVSFYYIDGNYYYNDFISLLRVAVINDNINTPIHIQGKYSNIDKEYAHVVGGGTSESDRKNIHTLDWNGNAYFAGDISLSREEEIEGSWNLGDAIAYIDDCPFDISTTLLQEPLILDKAYPYYWNSGRMADSDYAKVESMNADYFYRGTLSGATSTSVECIFKFIHNEQRIEGCMLENYYASSACTNVILQARNYWSEKIITPGMNISSLIDIIIDLQSRVTALEAK